MTIGASSYQSIVNEYPILGSIIPDNYIRSIDSARMMMQYAAEQERAALVCANKVIANHNRGILTESDYRNYAAYRHKVYDTQVLYLRQLRAALYQIPGGTTIANQLPWPTWLKPVRPESPRNLTPMRLVTPGANGTAGLGAFGVDDWVGVAVIAIIVISIAAVASIIVTQISSSFQQWIVLNGQTAVIETAIEARQEAFQACVEAGTNAETCAVQVRSAVPSPSQAAIDHFVQQSTGKGFVYYAGIVAMGTIVLGVGWYGWRQGWFKGI